MITTKYIGIIYWNNNTTVLDNTYENELRRVWRDCCGAHKIHSGQIVIRKAEYNTNGEIVGEVVKSFDDVADCIEQYNKEFNKR